MDWQRVETGGKRKLGPISKQGDRHLRRILVVGAHSVLRRAKRNPGRYPWLTRLLARRPSNSSLSHSQNGCIRRPNTWPHPNASLNVRFTLNRGRRPYMAHVRSVRWHRRRPIGEGNKN
jgi:hypothetical protein